MELVNSTAFLLFTVRDVWMNEIYVPKDGSVFRDFFILINIQIWYIINLEENGRFFKNFYSLFSKFSLAHTCAFNKTANQSYEN